MSSDTIPLLQGDNEDDVSIDICGNSPAPPLPPGKLYHVFFSYAESDREFADKLIQRLERELGYKCCDHQRDFVPGWKITDNIKHCVMSSLKTVVLISEDSVKSPWCSFEAEMTFHMSMDMRKKILIPILVDNCTIPDHLKPLTYIDARKDSSATNWWQKLVDATNQPDEVPIFENDLPTLSSQPYSFNPNFSNLEHLVTIKSKRKFCMREEISTKSVPSELCCRGLKVPYLVFKEEIEKLNKQLIFSWHCCCYCRLCWIPWIIILCIFGLVAFIILYFLNYSCHHVYPNGTTGYNCDDITGSAIVLALLLLGIVAGCILLGIFMRNRKEREMTKLVCKINKNLIQYQIMMTFRSYTFSRGFEIGIVYYNYQPCLDYISSLLAAHLSSVSEDNLVEEDITLEESARDTLTKHSCVYLRHYLDQKLSYPSEPRHTRNTLCLCQYVEEAEHLHVSSSSS